MATINIRIDENLKNKSEDILNELGLNMTSAMTIFLKTVVNKRAIPFSIELPNKETLKAIREVESISKGKKRVKKYKNVSQLRKDLGV